MIDRTVTTIIDVDTCIGCGECVKVCPNQTISMQDGKAVVTGDRSLNCGHCAAVCPVDAVRVDQTVQFRHRVDPHGTDAEYLDASGGRIDPCPDKDDGQHHDAGQQSNDSRSGFYAACRHKGR